MKRSPILLSLLFLSLISSAWVQFTSEETKKWSEWEEFLETATITDYQQLATEIGVTKPMVLTLEKNGITQKAIWKNPSGILGGFLEGWQWEIAAYRLSKYLGINMVPPTVERSFQGKPGSCQLMIAYEMDWAELIRDKVELSPETMFALNRATYIRWAFDNLIANIDRHPRNILLTSDKRIILIDHSRSFRADRKNTRELIYTEKNPKGPLIMKQLPRAFVDKLKTIDSPTLENIVDHYLTEKEIKAVLKRKELLLKKIAEIIKQNGEAEVLY